ncbi:MAG TPA: hypothetical protein VKU40_11840 [Thermoanaerobaculia bacterium]|nr:hypothetical protein [Thermoanaerobaculia bacterium]
MTSIEMQRGWTMYVVMIAALLLFGTAGMATADEAHGDTNPAIAIGGGGGTTCTCYWDADCPGDDGDCTGYGDCEESGKLDGTCKAKAVAQPRTELSSIDGLRLDLPQPADAGLVSEALDLYLAAYAVPVEAGTGRPDADLLAAAQRVDLGNRHAERHLAIQMAVHEALDATLGFDVHLPHLHGDLYGGAVYGMNPRLFANVRIVPHGADEMVEALRDGLAAALADNDPAAVGPSLAAFWQANPHYEPHHTGRYYPHGHHGESHDVTHQQIEAVTRIAERLVDLR